MNSLIEKALGSAKTALKSLWNQPNNYHFMNFEGRNYINGKWKATAEMYTKLNPATGKAQGAFPLSGHTEVEMAVESARRTFHKWKKVSRFVRSDYMYKVAQIIERRREELATVISLETGKNYNESIAEVNEALHMAQFAFSSGRYSHGEAVASEIEDKDCYMLRKPKGVIAIISPFNFPLAIGAYWCAAPAIVEGNTVVIKPSEDAPMSTQMAVEIYKEAGLPDGVVSLVHGVGCTGDLLARADVDHICFTGSAEVGQHVRKVAAESWHKTTSCEMGSKSACIIFDDVEAKLALEAAIASAHKLSGQRCVSSGRMIVQRSIVDQFAKDFASAASNLKTGNPFEKVVSTSGTPDAVGWVEYKPDESMNYGPLINQQGFEKVKKYNDMVLADAEAEVLLEPKYETINDRAFFSSFMVYKTEWRDVPYLKNEVFGPHVAIIPFDDLDDAIRIYNDTDYGLAVGVLTNDFRKARVLRDECEAGMIYWNGGSIAAESHLSFGGVKKSGNGFPSAARTYRAVTHEVSWTVNHADKLTFPQGMK
ncbi:aldehyde dehydrogenase [Candidatus Pacearchaeota archaeon]|jgi:aldehyde dehydrogenase (NAD+)|nr:aldehyde dehydrogenase [Candidatus Pacearchaeota archaeon]